MGMNKTFYILGVKVQPGVFGIKIFTKDKSLANKIWKYWYAEFAPNYLT
jgi:hypothetical protein